QLMAARTPPDRRDSPNVSSRRDEGFVEPGSYVSTTPAGVGFSIVTVPVVFAPPRFSRRLRCSVRRSTTGYSPSHLRRDPLPRCLPYMDTHFRGPVLSRIPEMGVQRGQTKPLRRFSVEAGALGGPGPPRLSESARHSAGYRGRWPPH